MRAEGPDALTLVDWDSRQARVIEQELRSCDTAGYSAAFGKQTTISVPFKWREAKSDPAFMILSIKQIARLVRTRTSQPWLSSSSIRQRKY